MTTYFDEFETKLRAVDVEQPGAWDLLYALDQQIVRDVSLAVMMPAVPAAGERVARAACPPWARETVHRLVLKWSMVGQPAMHGVKYTGPDYADDGDYRRGLSQLGNDLHTAFHSLALDPAWPYGDGPTAVLRALEGDAEEEREALATMNQKEETDGTTG